MPEELKARLSVDVSDLKSGMAEGAASTQVLRQASNALAESFVLTSNASKTLGESFVTSNNAAQVFAESQQRMAAQAAEAFDSSVRGASGLSQFAQAAEEGASSGGHLTDSTRAISGAFMELEGRIPIRALERFLATSEALQPILMAGFQAVGVIALAAALGQLASRAYEAYQNIVNLKSASDALDKQDISVARFVQSQQDSTERHIEDILEKTQGKSAALQQRFQYNANKPAQLDSLFYSDETKKLPDDVKGNYESTYKTIAPADLPDKLQKITTEVKNLQDALAFNQQGNFGQAITKVGDFGADGDRDPVQYMRTRLHLAQQIQAELSAASDNRTSGLQAVQTDEGSAEQKEAEERQRKAEEAERKAQAASRRQAEERMRSLQEQRNAQIQTGATDEMQRGLMGPQADKDFWTSALPGFQQGSAQYDEIAKKITADDREIAKSEREVVDSLRKRAIALQEMKLPESWQNEQPKIMAGLGTPGATPDNINRTGDKWNAYNAEQAKASELSAQNARSMALETIQIQEATGNLTALGAAKLRAGLDTDTYRAKIAALREELARLNAEAKRDPLTGQVLDPQQASRIAQVQNQITQTQGQANISSAQDTAKIQQDIAQPYLNAFGQIEQGWMTVQQQMLTGHKTFSQAMNQEAGNLVLHMIEGVEKLALKWAQHEIMTIAQHTAANEAKVASDASATAQSDTINGMSSLKQITQSAATAAAKAYQAMAGIPVVGPELGAVAAAATFIAVEGFGAMASFGVGTNFVPADMIAQIHAGERIIPAADNRELMNAVQGGGSKGGTTIHMPMTNHFHGASAGPRQYAREVEKRLNYTMARSR